MRESKKLRITSPDLLNEFIKHCEDGWSIQSFRGKMNDRDHVEFMKMCKNGIFKEIRLKYKKRNGKIYD